MPDGQSQGFIYRGVIEPNPVIMKRERGSHRGNGKEMTSPTPELESRPQSSSTVDRKRINPTLIVTREVFTIVSIVP